MEILDTPKIKSSILDRVPSFYRAGYASCHRFISWIYSNCDCNKAFEINCEQSFVLYTIDSPLSYFSNVGHALQAGLVTGVLHFDSVNV